MGVETLVQMGQVGIGLAFIWLIDRWARALVLELRRMNGLYVKVDLRLERIEKMLEVMIHGEHGSKAEAQRA